MSKIYYDNFIDGTSALDHCNHNRKDNNGLVVVRSIKGNNTKKHYSNNHGTKIEMAKYMFCRLSLFPMPINEISIKNISGKPINRMTRVQAIGTGALFTFIAAASIFFGI